MIEPRLNQSDKIFFVIKNQVYDIYRLAIPIVLSRAGMMTLIVVDAAMVGHFSALELGYQSIGLAPMMFIIVTSIGLMSGTLVTTANYFGSKNLKKCGLVWRRSLAYAFFLGIIGILISSFGEEILLASGQNKALASGGGKIIQILGWSTPALLIYIASSFFLEGLKRPNATMLIMLLGNLSNIFLNWILVFGNFGFPALGASGSAYSTGAVRIIMAVSIVYYIWTLRDHIKFNIRGSNNIFLNGGWNEWSRMRKIGFGGGASNAIESGAFSSMTIFAGLLGIIELGAFTLSFNMLALTFMFALGFGSATAVCVGNASGRGDIVEMRIAGWTGLALTIITLALLGSLLALFNSQIASSFTQDADLIVKTSSMIAFIGIVLVIDGGQSVMAHALRGCGETWVPAALHFISYILVMIPLGYYLSIISGRGIAGLFESILIASVLSLSLGSIRFNFLTKKILT